MRHGTRPRGGAIIEVPEWVRQQALATLFLHDRETPVAHLVYDSLLDEPGGDERSGERTLRFISDSGETLTVCATRRAAGLQTLVQIEPPARYAVAVSRKGARPLLIDTDSSGQARIPGLAGGLMSFRFVPENGSTSDARRTAWVVY